MSRWRTERGAVAVEFALVLPLLLALLLGTVEFGRAYNAQISVTHAAREAARVMAVKGKPDLARDAARTASPSLTPILADSQIALSSSTCSPNIPVKVTITHDLPTLTKFFGSTLKVTGKASMQCGG